MAAHTDTTESTMIDTPAKFRAKVEQMFRRANPDAPADLAMEWVWPTVKGLDYKPSKPRLVTTATGTREWVGMVRVSGAGFRTVVMHASGSDRHGFMVR